MYQSKVLSILKNDYYAFSNHIKSNILSIFYWFQLYIPTIFIALGIFTLSLFIYFVLKGINVNIYYGAYTNSFYSVHDLYLFSKRIMLDWGLVYALLYLFLIVIFYSFCLFAGSYLNKSDYFIQVDNRNNLVEMLKGAISYIFTIFNVILASVSVLLAIKNDLANNRFIFDMIMLVIPIVSELKFVQLWYSYRLSKSESEHYYWENIFKILKRIPIFNNDEYKLDKQCKDNIFIGKYWK